jgi:hypothetical protein
LTFGFRNRFFASRLRTGAPLLWLGFTGLGKTEIKSFEKKSKKKNEKKKKKLFVSVSEQFL